jgi:RNA polymerase sigma factor (sigma-70 family)
MIEAAKLAEVHDFIMSLPDQYDTKIGEAGIGLSGGQTQRLSIARALLRDVKILILDEATSALDSINEAKIYENLKAFCKNRTIIMISHRISTLKNADHIYLISDNTITEQGSFEELVEKKGEFYAFYHASEAKESLTDEENLSAELIGEISKEKVKEALKLSPIEREIVLLYYKGRLSYAKIARKLSLSPYDVSIIKKSARDKIKRLKELEVEI